jgi:hypothetical protein
VQLTENQKNIIEAINRDEVYDAFSFLQFKDNNRFIPFKVENLGRNGAHRKYHLLSNDSDEDVFDYFCTDIESIEGDLVELLSLIEVLEEYHLIVKIYDERVLQHQRYCHIEPINNRYIILADSPEDGDIRTYTISNNISVKPDNKSAQLQRYFSNSISSRMPTLHFTRIVKTEALDKFIQNGFRTATEVYNEQAITSAKNSSRMAIIIALITTTLSIIFNIVNINTTNRIQKENAKDSTESLKTELIHLEKINESEENRHNELIEKIDDLNIQVNVKYESKE